MRHDTAFRAQGATEYLVLLAVVLIIALVSIALLGFFPGTATDTMAAESQIYWRSASPIAITEWDAKSRIDWPENTIVYMRLRNTGSYPITITKVLVGNGTTNDTYLDSVWTGPLAYSKMSAIYKLAPGEESFIGAQSITWNGNTYYYWQGIPANRSINFYTTMTVANFTRAVDQVQISGSVCPVNVSGSGALMVNGFGFEYIANIQGISVTKRQVGTKPLYIKCGSVAA
jgi:hypothetical protein